MIENINITEVVQSGWLQILISPLAILLSASVGAAVALVSIRAQREIARRRATLDVILKSESDETFQALYSTFKSERNRTNGLASLLDASTESEKSLKTQIDSFLNHYELIAISIKNKILDETFYKEWMKSSYIKHFYDAKSYIDEMRKKQKHDSAYIEFERLVNKWENE